MYVLSSAASIPRPPLAYSNAISCISTLPPPASLHCLERNLRNSISRCCVIPFKYFNTSVRLRRCLIVGQLRACGTDLARLASLRLMCNTAYFDALQVGCSWCLCACARAVVENMMHRQALSLLLVFGHEFQREAAAVMLFSRVVAPEMFPAVLGACFADASKLRLQQVSVRVPFNTKRPYSI